MPSAYNNDNIGNLQGPSDAAMEEPASYDYAPDAPGVYEGNGQWQPTLGDYVDSSYSNAVQGVAAATHQQSMAEKASSLSQDIMSKSALARGMKYLEDFRPTNMALSFLDKYMAVAQKVYWGPMATGFMFVNPNQNTFLDWSKSTAASNNVSWGQALQALLQSPMMAGLYGTPFASLKVAADGTSAGIGLGASNANLYDLSNKEQAEAAFPKDQIHGVAGGLDFSGQIFLDPGMVLGKVGKIGAVRYLFGGKETVAQKAAESAYVQRAVDALDQGLPVPEDVVKYSNVYNNMLIARGDGTTSLISRLMGRGKSRNVRAMEATDQSADSVSVALRDTVNPWQADPLGVAGQASHEEELVTTVRDLLNKDTRINSNGWAVDAKAVGAEGEHLGESGFWGFRLDSDGNIVKTKLDETGKPRLNEAGDPEIMLAYRHDTEAFTTRKTATASSYENLDIVKNSGYRAQASQFLADSTSDADWLVRNRYIAGDEWAKARLAEQEPALFASIDAVRANSKLADEVASAFGPDAIKFDPATGQVQWGVKRDGTAIDAADKATLRLDPGDYETAVGITYDLNKKYGGAMRKMEELWALPSQGHYYGRTPWGGEGIVNKTIRGADNAVATVLRTDARAGVRAGARTGRQMRKSNIYWFQPSGLGGGLLGAVHRLGDELPDNSVTTKGLDAHADAPAAVKAQIRDNPAVSGYGIMNKKEFLKTQVTWSDGTTMTRADRARFLYDEWVRRATTLSASSDVAYRDATLWLDKTMWDDIVKTKGLDEASEKYVRDVLYTKMRSELDKNHVAEDGQKFFTSVDENGNRIHWYDPALATQLANSTRMFDFRKVNEILDSSAFQEQFGKGSNGWLKSKEWAGRRIDGATDVGDAIMNVWKPLVLLRPLAYPTRNVFEGQTRFLAAQGGTMRYLQAITNRAGKASDSAAIARRMRADLDRNISTLDAGTARNLEFLGNVTEPYGRLPELYAEYNKYAGMIERHWDFSDPIKGEINPALGDKAVDSLESAQIAMYDTKMEIQKELAKIGFVNADTGEVAAGWQTAWRHMPDEHREALANWGQAIYATQTAKEHARTIDGLIEHYDALGNKRLRMGEGLQSYRGVDFGDIYSDPRGGKMVRAAVSAENTTKAYIGSGTKTDAELLRTHMVTNNDTIPFEHPQYYNALADFANSNLRGESFARIVLTHDPADPKAFEEFQRFLRSQQGAKYRDMFNLDSVAQQKEWFNTRAQWVNDLIPNGPARQMLADGKEVDADFLKANIEIGESGKLNPVIGTIAQELPKKWTRAGVSDLWHRGVQASFKGIGTIPEDYFTRMPYARTKFIDEMHRFIDEKRAAGVEPTVAEANAAQRAATVKAIQETRRDMYTTMRKKRIYEGMRFVSAFAEAQYNSLGFWMRTLSTNPAYIGRLLQIASTPERFGLVDRDGNVAIPLPSWFHDVPGVGALLGDRDHITIGVDTLTNLWFNTGNDENPMVGGLLPNPSPFVSVAASEFMKSAPGANFYQWSQKLPWMGDYAARVLLSQYVGADHTPSADRFSYSKAIPAWGRNALAMAGVNEDTARSQQLEAWQSKHIRWAMDGGKGREPLPTDDEFVQASRGMSLLKILVNVASPLGFQIRDTDQQVAVDLAHKLRDQHGEKAFNIMLQQYPELVSGLASTRGSSKISATFDTNRYIRANSDMMESLSRLDPAAAAMIVPWDGRGQFDGAAMRWQQANEIPGQNGKHWLESIGGKESLDSWQNRIAMSRIAIKAEELTLKANQAGIKRGTTQWTALWDELNQFKKSMRDTYEGYALASKKEGSVGIGMDVVKTILGDDKFASRSENTNLVDTLRGFVTIHDRFVRSQVGDGGWFYGPKNADQRALYESYIDGLKEKDARFAKIYNAYFDNYPNNDKMDTTFDGVTKKDMGVDGQQSKPVFGLDIRTGRVWEDGTRDTQWWSDARDYKETGPYNMGGIQFDDNNVDARRLDDWRDRQVKPGEEKPFVYKTGVRHPENKVGLPGPRGS